MQKTIINLQRWLVEWLLHQGRRLDLKWFQLPVPSRREGRMCLFTINGSTMGYPDYVITSVRGRFVIGTLEFRNQWGYYCVRFKPDTPLNAEILSETYAMLKELRSR